MSSVDTQLHAVLLRAITGVKYDVLRTRASELSARYRQAGITDTLPALRDELDCLAYAVVRMPATYRAIQAALRAADLHVGAATTHLDLGGGTGAAAWAAASIWPGVQTQIVERQAAAVALGRRLSTWSPTPVWSTADLRDWQPSASVDLVTVAYVLNELTAETRQSVLSAAAASTGTIVLVEPGTPPWISAHRRGPRPADWSRVHDRCALPASAPVSARRS
ncbi:small ribosomal subunit Rsm22 family protein [Kribbella sp. NPDC058245]|uniref:small ribosomal subunit Rsm22 family protein n=1 Tax=Kribbella sp. NPDC058245 TaxID=3346399 RepID=UPI0036E1E768